MRRTKVATALLLGVLTSLNASGDSRRLLTACEVALAADEYSGKRILLTAEITLGAHDEYVFVERCREDDRQPHYIRLSYDDTDSSVRRLMRTLLKESKSRHPRVIIATLAGDLESSKTKVFGSMVDAHQELMIHKVERIVLKRNPQPH